MEMYPYQKRIFNMIIDQQKKGSRLLIRPSRVMGRKTLLDALVKHNETKIIKVKCLC